MSDLRISLVIESEKTRGWIDCCDEMSILFALMQDAAQQQGGTATLTPARAQRLVLSSKHISRCRPQCLAKDEQVLIEGCL